MGHLQNHRCKCAQLPRSNRAVIRTLPGQSLRTLATLDPPRPRVFVVTLSRTGIFCAVYERLSKGAARFRRVCVCGWCRTLITNGSTFVDLCVRSTRSRSQRPQVPQSTRSSLLLFALCCVVWCWWTRARGRNARRNGARCARVRAHLLIRFWTDA